jgi:hypothetical protein
LDDGDIRQARSFHPTDLAIRHARRASHLAQALSGHHTGSPKVEACSYQVLSGAASTPVRRAFAIRHVLMMARSA